MAKEVFQLEVQVGTTAALTGLNALDKKLKDVKDSADKIGKGNPLGGLNNSVKTLTGSFSGLGSVLGGLAFGKIATDAVTAMASFESLQTVLGTVTGSITNAASAMTLLKSVSASVPFTVSELGNVFIKLKSAGIEPTAEKLRLFADVASVTTDKVGALTAITDLYARTTAGGLGLEELNRLAERGIPVYDILGKKLGVNRLQISELGKSAEGAQIILRNLESALSDQFGGAAAKNMNTLNGQFDILKKNITNLFVGVGEGGVTNGLKELLAVFNQVIIASDGTEKKLGKVLGDALLGLARVIQFVTDNFDKLLIVLGVIAGFFLPFATGIRLVITNFARLTAGLSTTRGLWIAFTEVISNTATVWAKNPVAAFTKGFTELASTIVSLIAKYPKLASALGIGTVLSIVGGDSTKRVLPDTGAGQGRGNAQLQLSAYRQKELDDTKRVNELLTGRDAIISKIVSNINKETAAIGLSKQQAEETTKILEAQAQIKEKLLAGGTKTEAEAERESLRLVNEKAGEIRNAIAAKYGRILEENFKIFYKNSQAEISLIGKSSNEIEKQNKLREIQNQLGLTDLQWAKEKLNYEEQITIEQNARINNSLQKNLEGIKQETEYLKLGNEEREKRIALDRAAADAGFKDAEELKQKRPAEAAKIRDAIGVKVQTGIDVEGKKAIETLKEESKLLAITNDLDREREKKKQDIYKAIDPEGRGKKISDMQKNEIENLLATIEAQEKMLEVNKKINDGFATLGDAVSNWALGTEGSVKKVKLALIQLAALAAFKYIAGGVPTGAGGSFLSGVLGGLSGARAEGGPVSAGKSYLVGEKRPEVFVPSTNGYIVPNTAMMNTKTGATTVTLAPNLIIQGSVTGQTELENMFDQFSSAMANETQKFVITQLGQNGILAR